MAHERNHSMRVGTDGPWLSRIESRRMFRGYERFQVSHEMFHVVCLGFRRCEKDPLKLLATCLTLFKRRKTPNPLALSVVTQCENRHYSSHRPSVPTLKMLCLPLGI